MEHIKNDLLDDCVSRAVLSYSSLMDTTNIVPGSHIRKFEKIIYKQFKKKYKEIIIYELLLKAEIGFKLSIFKKLKIYFSGIKPMYLTEKRNRAIKEEIIAAAEIAKAVNEKGDIKSETALCSPIDSLNKEN